MAGPGQAPLAEKRFDISASCNKTSHLIDKRDLAVQILDKYGVSWKFSQRAGGLTRPASDMTDAEVLVSRGRSACTPELHCSDNDAAALADATNEAQDVVNAANDARAAGAAEESMVGNPVSALDYFSNPNYQIRCGSNNVADGKSTQPDKPATNDSPRPSVSFRIRGAAGDLNVEQGTAKFKSLKSASVSYVKDDEKDKRTRTANVFIGAALTVANRPLFGPSDWTGHYELVPYFGLVSDISKSGAAVASTTTNNRHVGLAFDGYSASADFGFNWALRPNVLWDLTDDSKLVTANGLFQPFVLNAINSWREAPFGWYEFLLDVELKHGHYASLGRRSAGDSKDFDRLGSKFGASLLHGDDMLPWSWTVTDTWFYAVRGEPQTLNQLESVFSIKFDKRELISLDFSYSKGRDPDTLKKDQLWKISLGFKY